MIDLRRLSAFVAVAEEGHITRAAERLGMAQPPLSRLVRGLEQELGTLLLRRLPRGVEPTEAGRALHDEARAVLDRAARLPETVRRVARGELGHLAIGFTSSAALHPFVPDVLRRYREDWPDVRVALEEAGTMELTEALATGRLDAAFIRSPAGNVPGLVVDPVLEEPMVAALPSRHALAGAETVQLADLAGAPFILYRRPAGPGLYDGIVAACRAAGFMPVVAQEAPRLPSTLSLVAAGLGITIVPASMGRMGMEGVAFRPLRDCNGLTAPIYLALRGGAGMSAAAGRLRALVRRDRIGLPILSADR